MLICTLPICRDAIYTLATSPAPTCETRISLGAISAAATSPALI
jgi:hypothetical protein